MARFALRKQEAIKEYFSPKGEEVLLSILDSLKKHFSTDWSKMPLGYQNIDEHLNHYPGDPYPTLQINDISNDDRMIEFYITGKKYDVYQVAFKGFTRF